MAMVERAYIRACGKFAEYFELGDTEKMAFWLSRKESTARELGV